MRKKYNTPHRSRVVKTRLSEDEYADFTARLAPYGISQSEFLRQAIRRATIRPVPSQMFLYCQALEEVVFPKVSTVNSGVFNYCTNLTKIDLGGAITRLSSAFMASASKVTALILRGVTTVPTLGSTTFSNTPVKTGTCYVYVPKELEATFKVASNWSTYASQIRAIEDYPEICG